MIIRPHNTICDPYKCLPTPSRYTNEKLASILEYIKSITSETFYFPKK